MGKNCLRFLGQRVKSCYYRAFILIFLLIGSSLIGEVSSVRKEMRQVFTLISGIYQNILKDEQEQKPEDKKKLELLLSDLAKSADYVRKHVESRPGAKILANALSQDARDALFWFNQNKYRETRYVLRHMSELCKECHERLNVITSEVMAAEKTSAYHLALNYWGEGSYNEAFKAFDLHMKQDFPRVENSPWSQLSEYLYLSWVINNKPILAANALKTILFKHPGLGHGWKVLMNKWIDFLQMQTKAGDMGLRQFEQLKTKVDLENTTTVKDNLLDYCRLARYLEGNLDQSKLKTPPQDLLTLGIILLKMPSTFLQGEGQKKLTSILESTLSTSADKRNAYTFLENYYLFKEDVMTFTELTLETKNLLKKWRH